MSEQRKKLKRFEGTEDCRFLTFSCFSRMNLLGSHKVRDEFVERIKKTHFSLEFDLYEWVVMPNHVHLMLRPTTVIVTVPKILQLMKREFAYRQLSSLRESGQELKSFWQAGGGYDRNIHSKDEFQEKSKYIRANPVTAGLVEREEEWKWSSAGWSERFWDVSE